jgi:aspartate aminotransferase
MGRLSHLIERVEPSPTIAAAAKANELKAQGRDIVAFTAGEPDFDTPQHVKDAAVAALNKGLTKYTAVNGILPLREVICRKLKRDQSLDYKPGEVVVTNGGKQAIAAVFAVLLNPGDEVVIPGPYWTSYPDMAKLAGGEAVIVPTTAQGGYLMTPESLRKACTARTRIILINSPSNPTGSCYSAAQLKALAEVIRTLPNSKEIVVLSDEVYENFTYDGFQYASILQVAPDLFDRVVIANAFSKAYAMTGWRVGYAAGPKWIIDAATTHQSQFTSNVCSIAQYAAAAAYNDDYAFPKMMCAEFQKRLDYVCEAVKEMNGVTLPVKPLGAFYAFLRVEGLFGKSAGGKKIQCANDFAAYLLEKFDTVVVQGEAFGDPGGVRISYATSMEQLKKGLDRIKQAAASIK